MLQNNKTMVGNHVGANSNSPMQFAHVAIRDEQ